MVFYCGVSKWQFIYIYVISQIDTIESKMRLLIGVISWGAVYSTIFLSEDKHGVNGLFDYWKHLFQTWDKRLASPREPRRCAIK
jgi:hypothetical protein